MAATDPRGRRIIYMSVPASYNSAEPEQSFEELRIADYIKAYTTTGSPPAPSPPEPVDASTRISLELPLLFQPYTEVEKVPGTLLPSAGIPQNSETAPASVGIDEVFISITCADEFSGHSFEELRYWAYTHHAPFLTPSQGPYAFEGYDAFQTVSCAPEHSNLSLEELRVAHLSTISPKP